MLRWRTRVTPCGDDTIESFCGSIHFFASRETAEAWTAHHPGTFVISIEDGFDIGRHTNAAHYGDVLRSLRKLPVVDDRPA